MLRDFSYFKCVLSHWYIYTYMLIYLYTCILIYSYIARKDIVNRPTDSKTLEEVTEGELPGDGRGAGGLDTYFYSHLNRYANNKLTEPNTVPAAVRNKFFDHCNAHLL